MATQIETSAPTGEASSERGGSIPRRFPGLRRGGAMRGAYRGARGGRGGGSIGRGAGVGKGAGRDSEVGEPEAPSTDSEEIIQLKAKYGHELGPLRDMFPSWANEDLLFAIAEANGDVALTAARITEGHAAQWGEVKTKKSKKDAHASSTAAATGAVALDGGKLAQGGTVGSYRGKAGAAERGRGGRGRGRSQDSSHYQSRTQARSTPSGLTATATATSSGAMPGSWGDELPTTNQDSGLADEAGSWSESPNEKMAKPADASSSSLTESTAHLNGSTDASGWGASTAQAISKRADAVATSNARPASTRPGLSGKSVPSTSGRSWAQIATPAPPKPKVQPEEAPVTTTKAQSFPHEDVLTQDAPETNGLSVTEDPVTATSSTLSEPEQHEVPEPEERHVPDASSLPIAAQYMTPEAVEDQPDQSGVQQPISSIRAPQFARMNSARSKQDAAVVMGKPGHASLGSIGVRFGSLNLGNDNAPVPVSRNPEASADETVHSAKAETILSVDQTESAAPLTSLDQLDSGVQSFGSYNARPQATAPSAPSEPLNSSAANVSTSSQGYGGLSGFNQYGAGGAFGYQPTAASYPTQSANVSSPRQSQASNLGSSQQTTEPQRTNFYDYSQANHRDPYGHLHGQPESKSDLHPSHSDVGEHPSQHGHAPSGAQVHQQPSYPGGMNYGYQPYYYMPYQPYAPANQSLGAYQYGQLGARQMYSYGQQKGSSPSNIQAPYGSNSTQAYGAGGLGNLGYQPQQQQHQHHSQQQPQHHQQQQQQQHHQHSPDVSYDGHSHYGQSQQHAPGLSLAGNQYGQGNNSRGGYSPAQGGLQGFLGSSATQQHSSYPFHNQAPSSMAGRPGSTDPSNPSSVSMNNQPSSATTAGSNYRAYGISSPYGDRSNSAMSGGGGLSASKSGGYASSGETISGGYGAQQGQHQPQHQGLGGYGYYRGGGQQYWGN